MLTAQFSIMGVWDDPMVSKFMFGLLCAVCILWLITACVDVVNFEESNKTDSSGAVTSAWSTSQAMLAMSSIATLVVLGLVAWFIYKLVRAEQTGGDVSAIINQVATQ